MLPLGFAGLGTVAVAAGLGVATTATRVRVGVALGTAGVGEAGIGVKVGGTVGVAGGLVAVGGGGGSVIVVWGHASAWAVHYTRPRRRASSTQAESNFFPSQISPFNECRATSVTAELLREPINACHRRGPQPAVE